MRRIRPFIAAVAALGAAFVASGCEDLSENATTTVSAKSCVKAWNHGTVDWDASGVDVSPWKHASGPLRITLASQQVPVSALGRIGDRVAVSDGSGTCQIVFEDAGRHALAVFNACCFRTRADAEDGANFFYHARGSFLAGSDAVIAAYTAPPAWNACQSAQGGIALRPSCRANGAPRLPIDEIYRVGHVAYLQAALAAPNRHLGDDPHVGMQPRLRWLGFRFRGAVAEPSEGMITYWSSSSSGDVSAHPWAIELYTAPSGLPLPRSFTNEKIVLLHVASGVVVRVTATTYRKHGDGPVVASLLRDVRRHLVPMPLPPRRSAP